MWFPSRYRELGSIDISLVKNLIADLDESEWYEDDAEKTLFAGDRPTQSIFFRYIKPQEYVHKISLGVLKIEDVYVSDKHTSLALAVEPLINFAASFFAKGSVVVKVQLARMLPGAFIKPHHDGSPLLLASHRLHIPILSHDKLRFVVDDEVIKMEEGKLYELNNQLAHSVLNPANAQLRIHLIIDILPPENNSISTLSNRFEFDVRRRQSAPIRESSLDPISLPKVLATSVVRGANKAESHGGIYLVDLGGKSYEQVVDWDNCDIDFTGRGWDRGLRGICFVGERIFVAATDAIYEFDSAFNIVNRFTNQYLRHAHEMDVDGKYIYVTSTGFDSVLRFDYRKGVYDKGYYFDTSSGEVECKSFNPNSQKGPQETNNLHINNVRAKNDVLFISGRFLGNLISVKRGKIDFLNRVPPGTHNVTPIGKGRILYNDSEDDCLVYSSNYEHRCFPVPRYSDKQMLNMTLGDERIARQAFGRGLCLHKNGIVIAGSSPSTITAYDIKNGTVLTSMNLSMDVRNAIHGLEVWPY